MAHNFASKVQRKIHRNFYKVLQSIHPQSADEYARKYNVTAKSAFQDAPFPWQIKKESQEHITRLVNEYEDSPLLDALIQLVADEIRNQIIL